MDMKLYGIIDDFKASLGWLHNLEYAMEVFYPGASRLTIDTARNITGTYLKLASAGTIAPLVFDPRPDITFWFRRPTLGIPTPATTSAISKIASASGYDVDIVVAWANAFYYWFKRGLIPYKFYAPRKSESIADYTPGFGSPDIAGEEGFDLESTMKTATTLALVLGGLYVVTTAGSIVKKLSPA